MEIYILAGKTREEVQKTYAKNPENYDLVRLVDRRGQLVSDHDIRLFEHLLPDHQGDMRVVEIGAGTGRFTLPALARNFHITATDVNESMLERLSDKLVEKGWTDRCTIQTEDIFNLSFDDKSIDYMFCLHVIPRFDTLEDQRAAIIELSRVLKPGGRLLFNYNNRRSFYGWLYKGYSTRPTEMKAILAEANMRIQMQRGKWFVNRTLINLIPMFMGRLLAIFDRLMFRFLPDCAWDVFIVAIKE